MDLRIKPSGDSIVVGDRVRLTAVDKDTGSSISGHWYIDGGWISTTDDWIDNDRGDPPEPEPWVGNFNDSIAFLNDAGEHVFELHDVSQVILTLINVTSLRMEEAIEQELAIGDIELLSARRLNFNDSASPDNVAAPDGDSIVYYPYPAIPNGWAVISPASGYNIRRSGSVDSERIGWLRFREVVVQIKERGTQDGENIWFRIRFSDADFDAVLDPGLDLAVDLMEMDGPEGWVRSDAFIGSTCIVPWNIFLQQVRIFDEQYADKSLLERITRARQMGHKKFLPFDQVITSGADIANPVYRDDREIAVSNWSMFLESQACEMPNGEIVDMYHFFVGLDVLQSGHKHDDHHIDICIGNQIENCPGNATFQNLPVGQNYSVATWAGDVGAAAADLAVGKSKDWESESLTQVTEEDRFEFYFHTRAHESDLLGDLDAWAATHDFVDNSDSTIDSLEQLLIGQYGDGSQTSVEYNAKINQRRKRSIILFLKDYQFTRATDLRSQPAANTVKNQIHIFSRLWGIINLIQGDIAEDPAFAIISEKMSGLFLDWLEKKASVYGVSDMDISN